MLEVADPARVLGLTVAYLQDKPAFAGRPFGTWTRVLIGQIDRGHVRFIADAAGRVRGFVGWARAAADAAEAWIDGRRDLDDRDWRDGDCLIINAWAADSASAHRRLLEELRRSCGRI